MADNRIDRSFLDRCGAWFVILAPGWHDALNPGSHVIVEATEAEALKAMEDVELCVCRVCWP